jgi:spermidine/putrescine transport system substrate-binding protein
MLPVRRLSRRSAILQGGGLAAAVTVLPRAGRAQQGVLNIFNWDTYVAPDTIPGFEAASGLRVRYDLFASNDELFAKLRAGNPGYDLIFPSNNYARVWPRRGCSSRSTTATFPTRRQTS